MRLAYFSHYYPPERNAPAERVHQLSKCLVERGHEIHVVTSQPNHPHGRIYVGYRAGRYDREIMDGVIVHRFPTLPAPNRGVLRRSAQFAALPATQIALGSVRLPKVDCVLATSPQILTGLAGLVFSRIRGLPFFLEVRDLWPESIVSVGAMGPKSAIVQGLERLEHRLYTAARGIVLTSQGHIPHIREHGIPSDRIAIVENGIDATVFEPRIPAAPLREELGISPTSLMVLFCGTIGMAHDVGLLARAAARLPDELDVHFVVVGDGADRENVAAEIAQLGVASRVHLCPSVAHKTVPKLLAAADACVVMLRASRTFLGVLPSKMFEAMAMEKPLLLGVGGEARRLLEDSGAGIAFEPGDVDDLIRGLNSLRHLGPSGRGTLGRAGRAYVASRHDRRVLAGRLEGFLEALR